MICCCMMALNLKSRFRFYLPNPFPIEPYVAGFSFGIGYVFRSN